MEPHPSTTIYHRWLRKALHGHPYYTLRVPWKGGLYILSQLPLVRKLWGQHIPKRLRCRLLTLSMEPLIPTIIWMSIRHKCTYRMSTIQLIAITFPLRWKELYKNDSMASLMEALLSFFNWCSCLLLISYQVRGKGKPTSILPRSCK